MSKPEARVNIAGHSIPAAVVIAALSHYKANIKTARFPTTIDNIVKDLKTKIGHVATTEYVPKKIGKVHTLETFREALFKIKAKPVTSVGLCHNLSNRLYNSDVSDSMDGVGRLSNELFRSWEGFSGNVGYPIRTGSRSAETQYDQCMNYFNPKSEYGKARLRLLDHMIQEVTIMIDGERKRQGF